MPRSSAAWVVAILGPEVLREDYSSLEEAGERYRVSRSLLNRLIRAGRLDRYRWLGDRKVYVRKDQADALFQEPTKLDE